MPSTSNDSIDRTASSNQPPSAPRRETELERHLRTFSEGNASQRAAVKLATDRASFESDSRSPPRSRAPSTDNSVNPEDGASIVLCSIIEEFDSFLKETTSLRRLQTRMAIRATSRIRPGIIRLSEEVEDGSLDQELIRNMTNGISAMEIALATSIPQNETQDRKLRDLFASAVSAAIEIEPGSPADTVLTSTAELGSTETSISRVSSEGDAEILSHSASGLSLTDMNWIDENVVAQPEEQLTGRIPDGLTDDVTDVSSPLHLISEPPTLEDTSGESPSQNLETKVAHRTEAYTTPLDRLVGVSIGPCVENMCNALKIAFVATCFVAVAKKVFDGGHSV